MTREAAILGVPACSFFRGRSGRIDEQLAGSGQLRLLSEPQDAAGLELVPRTGAISTPDNRALTSFICDRILDAARR